MRCAGALFVAAALLGGFAARVAHARVLDRFDDANAWTALASDQVEATLHRDGDALCLDFDFHGVSGYAAMRRRLPVDYPPNYAFSFRVRGDAPDNALQFKLIDASGDNVWWANRPDFAFPHDWQEQRYRKRQIEFAWGPLAERSLRRSESVEFTIYAGKGGRGHVCFDRLALDELPVPPATLPAPIVRASSSLDATPPASVLDGRVWRSDPRRGAEQTLTFDFGLPRDIGGVLLHWQGEAFASRYDVELSDDGRRWRRVRRVDAGNGGLDPLLLGDVEARYLRLALHDGPQHAYALERVDVRGLDFGASANAFFSALAKAAPRGTYPRGFYGEQTYWTVVGVDGGHESGLLSEDGALEAARGGFSIEPMLVDERGTLLTWADADIDHALLDGYLPLPSVQWQRDGLLLTTTAFGSGSAGASQLVAGYTLRNASTRARRLTLALAVRPFQVNPSVQFLNTPGGVSPIHDLALTATGVTVDGRTRAFALAPADAAIASMFDAGMVTEHLPAAAQHGPVTASVHDDSGLASGALLYRIELAPGAERSIALALTLDGVPQPPPAQTDAGAWLADRQTATAAQWRRSLDRVRLQVPPAAQPLADTVRTALAHILISRDGAALRPGTRAYARSWIRDGAMISEALLRLDHGQAARDYLAWYMPYQFKSGKVPCCVDARGSDPVAENDSHGELIHLAAAVYRYGGDRALLQQAWTHVAAAIAYMDRLRAEERNAAVRDPAHAAFRGLMPASISHEGYSAKPMHAYWDDFWALTGYKDAVDIAQALGRSDDARRIAAARDAFRADLLASIRSSVATHHIDYLPGSAELGDFDATSTTIALAPAGERAQLPAGLLEATFERYWHEFSRRRDDAQWKDYTPYEWRNVSAFVRLGWRDRAQQAIAFFMHDRRPAKWNQWAEVVGREAREARFIGDMPHGWVASDFIRAALDLFAYERESDHALVLAAGIPSDWLDGEGIAVDDLRTPYGTLGYRLKRHDGVLDLRLSRRGAVPPPGGFVLIRPDEGKAEPVRFAGRRLQWHGRELRIRAPADANGDG